MPDPLRVDAGELTTEEILAALAAGRRVVVRAKLLGGVHQLTLRHDGTTFYCDTPTTLHKHATEEKMRNCIHKMGYAKPAEGASDTERETNADGGATE